MSERDIFLADAGATDALGRQLAGSQPPGAVVFLDGPLGAGKSSLARAWLRALGVTGAIKSPTYTLVERYPLPAGGEAAHLDLYRLAEAGELDFLALDELADARLWLVEWPERAALGLPPPDLRIRLALAGPGRSARLQATSARGEAWLAAIPG
ncbi:tRNA (adenosine(37)-N6)-threonylcarbamoyltransferase complex ATPase subunit type 1 TsaE [Arenimonas soli]|uniref:tRNA threonylcarbamoyladenosine biosynthesis protein TsaE n=1 Tax=Arenimonas soli TaxID=2269504 RepID=A0ABQ1HEF5_9GAMM|nr:tRNA (adenosine(37)-N6)-threonylcarbamoyltransferase complex ATPase subunit type 1 TsaE [Arenimonas soli]GGA72393.1 tRNA (adenosine(37)-N6)-threonylcarbamoyltransferase complex ATPase subunit type 1 TsaE [Arenimonas soli]